MESNAFCTFFFIRYDILSNMIFLDSVIDFKQVWYDSSAKSTFENMIQGKKNVYILNEIESLNL